ncbi:alpha/beta fold hydrolase [Haloferax mediterranei ATCC 33500]|uniref:3-oxoadipate enol-lactonase n=1 Tax=Haloferax mediterranei (strain ATCC 33500 / DSM 1411 / JCM 8866 / NBRC 14739 / NCIMB 2177 / R-4) TaxID=523841 RepID=I3R140_HALMT|nr:alpha/beta hydrolase [Haloferax mediterranei]AFK17950.1 3-oxoadipate enol-lactonase [Haloferax mediterranei ATCC 33500]AHZ22628.1 3-oxoadipate enol-lactonase [Haloferax mediterranei ATCC 33500]EMA02772.1 3-oxoadipate enol-lactonase [Haloferax mediterranei ATCC 33500]MDX5988043.1 alpha/beta hydrolase [Haloferax mediterranei ATCC 33500]QCQ74503.1 alpha/beta fold hydrolase [Haloferax mediterranei ATCC 33500]
MPTAVSDGVELYYDSDGESEPVVFVGDAGYGAWQWGWQHAAVAGPFESVVMDLRGSGQSDAPSGPYSVETLVSDLVAVLADANIRKAHLVGFGLGGLVALEAARTTSRVRGLVLVGTAASGTDIDPEPLYGAPDDPHALRESLTPALSDEFRTEQPDVVDQIVEWRGMEDADPDAWAAQTAAIAEYDADPLYEVTVPTLVIHGDDDPVWPVDGGRALANDLPRGEFESFEGARHLVTVEQSRVVNDAIVGFLESLDD